MLFLCWTLIQIFYGRHHKLVDHYIISISQMVIYFPFINIDFFLSSFTNKTFTTLDNNGCLIRSRYCLPFESIWLHTWFLVGSVLYMFLGTMLYLWYVNILYFILYNHATGYIYNTSVLSKHIGNMSMRLRNRGKGEALPSLYGWRVLFINSEL